MSDEELRALDGFDVGVNHLHVERALREAGWEPCGAGDWAIALASPSGSWAARISPFDPAARYTAELYRRGASTGRFPRLHTHRELEGGGALTVMERLDPVPTAEAAGLHARLRRRDQDLATVADLIDSMHALARAEQEWWGPTDENPANVMRSPDGGLVVVDPYFADGPSLYRAVLDDPDRVVRAFPRDQRRYMLDLPLASSGAWDAELRERMRRALQAADPPPP